MRARDAVQSKARGSPAAAPADFRAFRSVLPRAIGSDRTGASDGARQDTERGGIVTQHKTALRPPAVTTAENHAVGTRKRAAASANALGATGAVAENPTLRVWLRSAARQGRLQNAAQRARCRPIAR